MAKVKATPPLGWDTENKHLVGMVKTPCAETADTSNRQCNSQDSFWKMFVQKDLGICGLFASDALLYLGLSLPQIHVTVQTEIFASISPSDRWRNCATHHAGSVTFSGRSDHLAGSTT
jgi:hypothetical protein